MSFFGPLAGWELLRLGRSGALRRARVALALGLLAGLGLAYARTGRGAGAVSIAEASRVAESYLFAYLVVQVLAVVVLTPVVAAGAISDEKERGRLDFLRSSMLSPHEIVLGKYLGRVTHLFGILATGLPILALSMLFGGVDLELLAAGTVVTVTSVFALAAYSLSLAVGRANLREVLLVAYLTLTVTTVAGFGCGWIPGLAALSPISSLVYAVEFLGTSVIAWVYFAAILAVHALLTIHYLRTAIDDLTALAGDAPSDPGGPPPPEAFPLSRVPRDRGFVPMMLGDDDPFAWRERHFAPRATDGVGDMARGCGMVGAAGALFLVVLLVVFAVSWQLDRGPDPRGRAGTPATVVAQFVTAGGTALLMLLLATRTATSVASERERDTLTALLVLPVDRGHILRAKWVAALRWARSVFAAVVVAEVAVAVAGGVTGVAAMLVVVQIATAALLASTLGLWFSVASLTATRAVAGSVATLLILTVAPPFARPLAAFSPPAGVWLAHDTPSGAVVPVTLQLLAAAALGWSAVRRFERYGR